MAKRGRALMGWQVALRGRLGELSLDLSFTSNAGPTLIVGPNGAGKTTVLRAIAGARLPFHGEIRLSGRTLVDGRSGVCLPPEERNIGYVPQGYALFPHLRAVDNVAFGCRGSARERKQRALSVLERFEARHLAARYPSELSGGEQQRVALARALAIEPRGLLLDEPLSALDARTRRTMRSFLAEYLSAEERPAIVVSHDVRDVLALGGHVLVLEDGKITQQGSAHELARAPATDFVSEFFDAIPSGSRPATDPAPS
jgi:ABC-type sulfate/molybdate transport systems ATPase subunit